MEFWNLLTVASVLVIKILLISVLGVFLSTQYVSVLIEDSMKHINKVKDRRLLDIQYSYGILKTS